MLKRRTGTCHCGAVRFEVSVDLAAPTYRCNCSICSRTRFWPAIVLPKDFTLLSGEMELRKYVFGNKANEHFFCRNCGVRPFGIGWTPDGTRIYGVNIGCLEDVSPEELAAAPIVYVDGAHDRWDQPPAVTSYL